MELDIDVIHVFIEFCLLEQKYVHKIIKNLLKKYDLQLNVLKI
jgi:hypothetical protein